MLNAPRFDGRVALVTGAASGIGRATAVLLAERGASVLATDIAPGDGVFPHDVTREADWERAVAEAVRRHGRLDILVSSAGTTQAGPFLETSLATLGEQAAVHVEGSFLGIRAALAQFRAQAQPARGAIVCVASIAGLQPVMDTHAYGTAKAALLSLVRSAAVEAGQAGDFVRVNAVCPGGTRTPMTEAAFDDAYWADLAHFAHLPLKRFAKPDDIAEAIMWLAHDEAEFATGEALVVDGGWLVAAA